MGAIADKLREVFNFTVASCPLTGPDNVKTPHFGLFRTDTWRCIGKAVSKQYVPHTVEDMIALGEACENVFDNDVEIDASFVDGHYVTIAPSKDYRRSIFGTADNIFPRVIIRGGYNGKAFSAIMGYYRDACKNMAMMRSVNTTAVTIRHNSNLATHMSDLIDQFNTLKESWNDLGTMIEHMQNREVQLTEFLSKIYPIPAENSTQNLKTRHENIMSSIFRRILRERVATGRPRMDDNGFNVSLWEAFNGVQGYVQHDATRKLRPSQFERVLLAADDKAVKHAETLAMQLVAA